MKKNLFQRSTAYLLSFTMIMGLNPAALAAEVCDVSSDAKGEESPSQEVLDPKNVVADWKFGEKYTEGSIAEATLVIQDQSGNNNNLEMQTYVDSQLTDDAHAAEWEDYLYFSEDSMTGSDGSLVFNGDDGTAGKTNRTGADFITADDAPINQESFETGYTMEFLYYFPDDWTAADAWMGLIARQTDDPDGINSMDEPQLGTMSAAISNCKEIQFLTSPAEDNHEMDSAAWSVSMDEGGVWYHIAIISDGQEISTYVNGCEAFRDYASDEMIGMYADPEDGRFRIGSSWWKEGGQTLDKFLQGSLQEVRISKAPLDKEQWLVPNPEDYVDSFGSNEDYQLKNEDNYNIVLLPDTQNTVEFRPDVMNAAIDGLIDSADALNVAGVIHLGDVVDNNDNDEQYVHARESFYRLPDSGVKFLVQMGNHDGGDSTYNYSNSFSGKSPEWTSRTDWYLTQSPNGDGNSSYMLLQAGSYNYLIISLSCSGSASGTNGNTGWDHNDEDWLRSVLEKYPNCPTIVTTHDLQNCSDTEPSAIKLSSRGNQLWNIVKDYDQVFMLVGGHSHGSGVAELTNTNGKQVISILTDLQFGYNGGNGWFRYLEFDESADKIYYSIYSPYAASLSAEEKTFFDVNFLTGKGNEGEVAIDFDQRFDGMANEEQAPEVQNTGVENGSASLDLTKIAGYSAGQFDVDGGVMEIVAYNSVNHCAYAVNGKSGRLAVIPMSGLKDTGVVSELTGRSINVKSAAEAMSRDFTYGDMTSVAVSPDGKVLAAALQAESCADAGRVALFTCSKNGTLTLKKVVTVGVQPDMVTFADNNTVLTADEGEPREGYGSTDPKGSVSVVDVKNGTADVVYFTAFDNQRENLTADGIILKKDTAPSVDLEPEYIAVSGGKAYVTLQEANAIAVLDIKAKEFTGIYSAGFEDHSVTPVDIDKKDEKYGPKTYGSLMGIRMPDGIAAFEKNDKTYLLTANEGDSREWGDYVNEDERNFGKGKTSPSGAITTENSGLTGKVVFFDPTDYDGLDSTKDYLFGGRSFSLYEVSSSGIQEVFTSGADFERMTAKYLPEYFNCSNDDATLDDRSGKKGPEAESVAVGQVKDKIYAFVALERIGGIMVYDVTDPGNVSYVNYINSRDFATTIPGSEEYEDDELDKWVTGGDVAPEGLAFVSAAESPTGKDLLLAACEVSGTLAVYEMTGTQPEGESGGSSSGGSSSSSSSGSYTVSVDKTAGGKVMASSSRADKGDTVTVTVKPDKGYELDQLTVTDQRGNHLALKDMGSSTFTFTMPNAKVTVEASFKRIETEPEAPSFADVPGGAYYADAVDWAVKQGITSGTSASTFGPDASCTRSQMVTFLWRANGSPKATGTNPFTDVDVDDYYYDAVLWAAEQGITSGTSSTTFSPDAVLTRGQTVTFLWRASKAPVVSGSSFSDVAPDAYYADAVSWAVSESITAGTGNNNFSPDAPCTRAQIVTFMYRDMQ